jgi:predicted glutamine amidotransferase
MVSHYPIKSQSELAFCWLMQELAKAHASVPTIAEPTGTLRELAALPAAHGTFNFILSNGQALWAHCSTHLHHLARQHPFATASLQDEDMTVDFARLTSADNRVAIIVTEPLTRDEPWVAFAPGELRVFEGGRPGES